MDVQAGNPFNTSFGVKVLSEGFQGSGEFECDVQEFQGFVRQLRSMYELQTKRAFFRDIGYGNIIELEMNHCGQLTVKGIVYGNAKIHKLEYEFHADQTSLAPFLLSLESIWQ